MKMNANQVFVFLTIVLAIIVVLISLTGGTLRPPAPWLIEWTDWAMKYVGLVVSGYGIVKIVNGTAIRLAGKHQR